MERIIEVTGGEGGTAYLVKGDKMAALIDCGMAYCAAALIANCRRVLGERPLDYVFITHSHYDHVGAIPCLRKEWPKLKVLGAEYAQRIFTRPTAQQVICALGEEAARQFTGQGLSDYDITKLAVDTVIEDGDRVDLGGIMVKVLGMPGHTQCSLAFLLNGTVLFASETTGVFAGNGKVYPAFITSCREAIAAIYNCQKTRARVIISPHYGPVWGKDRMEYWQSCLRAVQEAQSFIVKLARQGHSETEILACYEAAFRDEAVSSQQPLTAFRLNTAAMIKTVIRENGLALSQAT